MLPTGRWQEILREDFEGSTSWQHQADESTATTGDWRIANPVGTGFQPEDDATPGAGTRCLFTALNFIDADIDDVDDGVVVARSGPYDLSAHPEARVEISRWFANRDIGEDPEDFFRLEIRESPLAPDQLLEELDSSQSVPEWTAVSFRVADHVTPGPQVELKASAADGPAQSNIIEAAIDEIVFWDPVCQIHDPAPNPVDTLRLNLDGDDVVLSWTRPGLDPAHGEAVRYAIYRSPLPDTGWVLEAELHDPGDPLSYPDVDAAGGAESIFYQVIAGNDAGEAEPAP